MRKLWMVVALALAVSTLAGTPAHAYEPNTGALFNVPRPWGSKAEKFRLVKHVEKAIRKTPGPTKAHPAPEILISTYLLDRKPSVDALVKACRRGVSIRVIMDADINNKNSRRLINVLNADNVKDDDGDGKADRPPKAGPCGKALPGRRSVLKHPPTLKELRASMKVPTEDSITWGGDRSYAKKCTGACRGKGGNMHSKFYAFSKTGTARKVVIVSSSNLNKGGAVLGWNDMYTMKNRPVSYQGYRRIHREMTEDTRAGRNRVEIVDGPFVSRFFPMVNAGKKRDPALADLQEIRCNSSFGKTKIYVSMFYWKGKRGNYLAARLLHLARQGCKVSIIYGAPSLEIAERLRGAAKRNLITLYDSRWDFNNNGLIDIRTHAKYVAVKGRIGSDRSAHKVMTGSPNWVAGSLSRGDENTLNIAKKKAYRQYLNNWTTIRKHSRKLPYNR